MVTHLIVSSQQIGKTICSVAALAREKIVAYDVMVYLY